MKQQKPICEMFFHRLYMFHNKVAEKCLNYLKSGFPLEDPDWKSLNKEYQELSEGLAEQMNKIVPLAKSGELLTKENKLRVKHEDTCKTKDQLLREQSEVKKVIACAKRVRYEYNQRLSQDVTEMCKKLQTHFNHVS